MKILRLEVLLTNNLFLRKVSTQIRKYNLGEIASKLGLELIGDNFCQISGIGTLLNAVSGELSFLSNPSYTSQVAKTKASAVIIEERYAKFCPTNALISANPYLSFAGATHLFLNPALIEISGFMKVRL